MGLKDQLYFRRLTSIYAGLNQGYLTYHEDKTIKKIRNLVAVRMTKSGSELLPDEAWAAQVGNELLQKMVSGLIEESELIDLLLIEFHKRLQFRRLNDHSALMGFYDFSYVTSICYMVIGARGGDMDDIYGVVRDLKRALVIELDLYLFELQPKISGKIKSYIPHLKIPLSFNRAARTASATRSCQHFRLAHKKLQ